MSRLAIVGAEVLNPGEGVPVASTVLVDEGRFVELLDPAKPLPENWEQFDASGKLLIPGLINPHMHGHANLLRGLCNAWCLEMSLINGPWMAGSRDPDTIYTSTLLGAYEMLSQGVTACYDLAFEYPMPTKEGAQAMAAAYRDAGMRAWIAPMIADKPFVDAIPGLRQHLQDQGFTDSELPSAADGDAILSSCREIFDTVDWVEGVLEPAIAPTIAMHCSSGFMRACKALADEYGARVHMHVAESRAQAQAGRELYGDSIVAETDRLGLIDERFNAAHGVWLDKTDFRILADRGASLVHMPGSNLRLGCGIASMRSALDTGLTLGLATDGANSSDSLSVFRAMHLAAMVSRVWGKLPEQWLGSQNVFRMATEGNAAVVGQSGNLGRIEKGYRADVALLDLDTITFTPRGDCLNQLVNAESGSSVDSVMVEGEWVFRERQPTRFDAASLRRRANLAVEKWREQNADLRQRTERLIGPVVEYTHEYGQQFEAVKRYL